MPNSCGVRHSWIRSAVPSTRRQINRRNSESHGRFGMPNNEFVEGSVITAAKKLPDPDEEDRRNEEDDEEEELRRKQQDDTDDDEIHSDDMRRFLLMRPSPKNSI